MRMWMIAGLVAGGAYFLYRSNKTIPQLMQRLWDLVQEIPRDHRMPRRTRELPPITDRLLQEAVGDLGGEFRSALRPEDWQQIVLRRPLPDKPMSEYDESDYRWILEAYIRFLERPSAARNRVYWWFAEGKYDTEVGSRSALPPPV